MVIYNQFGRLNLLSENPKSDGRRILIDQVDTHSKKASTAWFFNLHSVPIFCGLIVSSLFLKNLVSMSEYPKYPNASLLVPSSVKSFGIRGCGIKKSVSNLFQKRCYLIFDFTVKVFQDAGFVTYHAIEVVSVKQVKALVIANQYAGFQFTFFCVTNIVNPEFFRFI